MKLTRMLLLCLLCGGMLTAQSDAPTVFSQVGKAKLIVPGVNKKLKVAPGAALNKDAQLVLKKKTTVGVFYDDGYAFLSGPGTFEVAPLMQSSRLEESDFVEVLGSQLAKARNPYFYRAPSGFASSGPGPSGGGTSTPIDPLTPPKKPEVDGHGNKEAKLVPLSPLRGKVSGDQLLFSWEAKPGLGLQGVNNFSLRVMDDDKQEIFSRDVSGMQLTVSAAELGLQAGEEYSWTVTENGEPDNNSGQVVIQYEGSSGAAAILERLRKDEAYQQSGPAAKMMMEAATLERFGFMSEALATIERAASMFKKNTLVQAMAHAFAYYKGTRAD